jgi:hypothetical protein
VAVPAVSTLADNRHLQHRLEEPINPQSCTVAQSRWCVDVAHQDDNTP